MNSYLKTLSSSFEVNLPVISSIRPDGSLTLTFSTQSKDVVAIRVISAADLGDQERLHTVIEGIKTQLAVMTGKMNRKATTRNNMVYLNRFRNEWAQAPLAAGFTKPFVSPDAPVPN
ncbi:DUF3509 domain-containing protein [Pseudomonas asuensis]|uniref:DUF3509 domain-containing protein n=1 Tax=Pseudomonas asuensis TaxID=1825787 RepID=A0ABQ2GW24_9PSED|nr:DUF3509 domain-containing protein [Pseudomonas asuensis]GGM14255.1 hypothetical protein GCM10009425_26660 [Pseudomonas asuensis]